MSVMAEWFSQKFFSFTLSHSFSLPWFLHLTYPNALFETICQNDLILFKPLPWEDQPAPSDSVVHNTIIIHGLVTSSIVKERGSMCYIIKLRLTDSGTNVNEKDFKKSTECVSFGMESPLYMLLNA